MRYEITEMDELYCVFRIERLGERIVAAFETLEEAKEAVVRYKAKHDER